MTSHSAGIPDNESTKKGVVLKDGSAQPQPLRKVLGGSVVGTIVEYYDFGVYGYMATVLAALFFSTGNVQRSNLPSGVGCNITHKGAVKTTRGQRSSVKGVWVCGDAAEDSQYVIVAAAEGAKAAMAINKELQAEDQP